MTRIDFKEAFCRWVPGKPDELHVTACTEGLDKQLTKAIGTIVMSKGGGNTRYSVLRKVDGTFILTSDRKARL